MPGRECDDQVAITAAAGPPSRSGRHSEPREGPTWFHFAGVAHVDRVDLHPERRRHRLDGAKLADPGGLRITKDPRPRHARRDFLQQLQPFPAEAEFEGGKPVTLPPGRAKLPTKPAATGSATNGNTIGTLRVACCNGTTVGAARPG